MQRDAATEGIAMPIDSQDLKPGRWLVGLAGATWRLSRASEASAGDPGGADQTGEPVSAPPVPDRIERVPEVAR